MPRILPDRALGIAVARIERTAADKGKRAVALVLGEPDRRAVAQIRRHLGIDSKTVTRATWVVLHAPELVPKVMSGEVTLGAAARIADLRRPGRQPSVEVVTRLPIDHVRIDAAWVAAEIAAKMGGALDVLGEMPRSEDVAEILRAHPPTNLNARVARAAAWLARLAAELNREQA